MRLLFALRHNPIATLARLARERGDVARFRLGRQEVVLLSHPELVEEILLTQGKRFVKENVVSAHWLGRPRFREDTGFVTSQDRERHLVGRRQLQPAFSAGAVERLAEGIETESRQVAASWRDGQEIDVGPEAVRLATKAIVRVFLGIEADERRLDDVAEHLHALVRPFNLATARPLDLARIVRVREGLAFARGFRELEAWLGELLSQRSGRGAADGDVLAILAGSEVLDDDARVREALVVLLAGTDTTASALAWSLAMLAVHPDQQGEILDGREATAATVRETLRLFPPSWYIGRRAVEPVVVGRVSIERDTVVLLCPFLLQRDARWYAEPSRFRPSRWADDPPPPRCAYLPFGMGPRRCLGERVAVTTATLVLRELAARWQLRARSGERISPIVAASLRPGPLRIRVERREAVTMS